MRYTDLDKSERLALAGLLSAMVRLDGSYTREESTRLSEIAAELGAPEAFWDAIDEASRVIGSSEQLEEAAAAVTRREARVFILEVLDGLAAAGGLSGAEDQMMDQVAALWADDDESGPYR